MFQLSIIVLKIHPKTSGLKQQPFYPLEKDMATHSNTLAWRIPWTEKPGRLQSTRSQRVWHLRDEHNNSMVFRD